MRDRGLGHGIGGAWVEMSYWREEELVLKVDDMELKVGKG